MVAKKGEMLVGVAEMEDQRVSMVFGLDPFGPVSMPGGIEVRVGCLDVSGGAVLAVIPKSVDLQDYWRAILRVYALVEQILISNLFSVIHPVSK